MGGNLWLNNNQLKSLPANFGELKVGRDLRLNSNQLQSLPEGFESISVGGTLYELYLSNKQLARQMKDIGRYDVCCDEETKAQAKTSYKNNI